MRALNVFPVTVYQDKIEHNDYLKRKLIPGIIDSLPENFSVANFKEKSSLTRKYAIPFLEFLDKELITKKINSSGLRKKIN